MQAPIHTITNETGSIKIHASRMQNVTVKTRGNKFENVTCIYYTVTNVLTGESASYAHIEMTPNTLTQNVVAFMYEKLAWYTNNAWYISHSDTVDYIYYA
jgi:hypothetical protein